MNATSSVTVRPNDPAKLQRTLCNHWRHKFEIERPDDDHARIPFSEVGPADFAVDGDALVITLYQPEAEPRERLQGVIASHLRRFERNEDLAFDWRTA
ncbi:DUF2218 domain-containing protein [Pseudoxanthomonas sp.]|uniref:DUF2218 domain-containing protein n=1 Tax=Pseudoxanthomonas sp. TaxID=1871049 RepID=UPI0028C3CD83|nr:DUF2218 domain-containing protein [Pseudoxanthomonas sp.]